MRALILAAGVLFGLGACTDAPDTTPSQLAPVQDLTDPGACKIAEPDLRMNEVQSVGSHNSYKQAIPKLELMALRRSSKEIADALDYSHAPLSDQLHLGMRQLELDVFYDPEGGRYSDPYLPRAIPAFGRRFSVPEMDQPGFKVMHIQDVDQRSHCALFTQCLSEISEWSATHPGHTPILILINAKQDRIELDEAVEPLPFTAEAFDALDAEILSVLSSDQLITPDTVRGEATNLREAVTETGWPSLETASGKILFALDEKPSVVETYLRGQASLEGLPMFVNSTDETADHAAYLTINDPLADGARIRSAVEAGFLVRTRADADTVEARTNDTSRREAAFASGAQYISTDYYEPRKALGDYKVILPDGAVTRCRP